jgi:hypothetical protein
MYIVVVNVDNVPREIVCVTPDAKIAEDHFLDACKTHVSNWDEHTAEDREAILEDAYCQFGHPNSAVVLMDISNVKSDGEILAELTGTPPPHVHQITNWIRTGEVGECNTLSELMSQAGNMLDKIESHEIFGEVIFEAADGKVYVLNCEAVIGPISPAYLKQVREEESDE